MVELVISFNKEIAFEVHRLYFKNELDTYIWEYVEVIENENK